MKKIICALLLASLGLCFVSCGNSGIEVPEGMQLVPGENQLYYLFVPVGWTTNTNGLTGAFYSAEDTSNITVAMYEGIADEADSGNTREPYIDRHWEKSKTEMEGTLKSFAVIEEGTKTTLGGADKLAKKYEFSFTVDGASMKCRQVITYHGGLMFVLTYTAKAENFDSHSDDMNKTAAEFRFQK